MRPIHSLWAMPTLITLLACGGDLDKPSQVQTDYTSCIQKVSTAIESRMKEQNIPGLTVALVDGDRAVWIQGFGKADLEKNKGVNEDTLFEIGSISKTFTATMIMQLVEQKKLSLDTRLVDVLPEFKMAGLPGEPEAYKKITIRHMLTHHSGIPGDLVYGGETTAFNPDYFNQKLKELEDHALTRPVDTAIAYSNTAFCLLGKVIERASESTFKAQSQQLFKTLGMENASFYGEDLSHPDRCATGYLDEQAVPFLHCNSVSDGSIRASAKDMAQYLKALLANGKAEHGAVLRPETFRQMIQRSNGHIPLDGNLEIGLSWFLNAPGLAYAGSSFGHGGSMLGFSSYLEVSPMAGLGFFVSANSEDKDCMEIAHMILKEAIHAKLGLNAPKEPTPEPLPVIQPDMSALKALEGFYPGDVTFAFKVVDGCPCVVLPAPDGNVEFKALLSHPDKLFSLEENPGIQFYFTSVSGRDVAMVLAGGQEIPCEKFVPGPIPNVWKARCGSYTQTNLDPAVWPQEVSTCQLFEYEGALVLVGAGGIFFLEPLDENHAWIRGLGRTQGDWVRAEVLPSGKTRLHVLDYDMDQDENGFMPGPHMKAPEFKPFRVWRKWQ